ncbi:MAG: hypothetical protein ACI8UO_005496 [Verrucomicrobiales bacterium]|jgi:hypothetical protein
MKRISFLLFALTTLCGATFAADVAITTVKAPGGGLQPEVFVDADGNLHLLYFQGEPRAGNLMYTKRPAGAADFLTSVQVNTTPNAAVAMGTIRGGHLAIGKDASVHVSWMGSKATLPNPDDHKMSPMLYARSIDEGASFEPEKNVITNAYGLDGGGTVAADGLGNVHVVWHAPKRPGAEGEVNRTVWIASSKDNGATFAAEREIWNEKTGVCGCCGLRAFATPAGETFVLYRAATGGKDRDMYLLRASADDGAIRFNGSKAAEWSIQKCPMSSASFALGPNRIGAAWESEDKVFFSVMRPAAAGRKIGPIENPRRGNALHKHPSIAFDDDGNILLVWTVGRGWGSAGTAVWRVFKPNGDPTDQSGEQPGTPPWSKAAAVFHPVDGFLVFY